MKRVLKSGLLPVGDGHKIYFELIGNPKGKPVIFLHGGPGGNGFSDTHIDLFDYKNTLVLFFDQRGCGKSRAVSPLLANTTRHLIQDIEALRLKLCLQYPQFSKVSLVGSSWGTTLALCYAIVYPKKVASLTLSGVFLGTQEEENYLRYEATKNFAPEVWDFISLHLPRGQKLIPYCTKNIKSKHKATRQLAAKLFALSEDPLLRSDFDIKKTLSQSYSVEECLPGIHYSSNHYFMSPNFVFKHVASLKGIPCLIVHGRQDMVCLPKTAFALHKMLPGSHLVISPGSHRTSSRRAVLITELRKFLRTRH